MYRLFFILLLSFLTIIAGHSGHNDSERGLRGLRFLFYNVENLFDPFNDSLKRDDDFTPDGQKRWTWRRMQEKCENIARVIVAAGGWEAVEMIGLCEVENALVIRQLLKHPLLAPYNYEYIVTKSPDIRGINLAFLYRSEKIKLIDQRSLRVSNPKDTSWKTRDILYLKLLTLYTDTLHLFLNHWPSRFGGRELSDPKRALAAKVLRGFVDSLFSAVTPAYIIISGDFNDEPSDSSVRWVLGAAPYPAECGSDLVNMVSHFEEAGLGTHAHRDVTGTHFSMIDQFIVSRDMLNINSSVQAKHPEILRFPFLLTENAAGEEIPFRTYIGPRYIGGFSDHLPIMMDITLR